MASSAHTLLGYSPYMAISVFDLFSVGIGPSSSHTVGPMRAASSFAGEVLNLGAAPASVKVELFGSLALTGAGHGTDRAVIAGLEGNLPEQIAPELFKRRLDEVKKSKTLNFGGKQEIQFAPNSQLSLRKGELLPRHSNGMRFVAFDAEGRQLLERIYYSVGGGFIIDGEGRPVGLLTVYDREPELRFSTAQQLLDHCSRNKLRIADVMMDNELTWRSETEIKSRLLEIALVMRQCIDAGLSGSGVLPGGLRVRRRAPDLYKKLNSKRKAREETKFQAMDWLSVYAIAVNEENAALGRIVTAPTNGAAGIIPAVLRYYTDHVEGANEDGIIDFLLTAGAVGILYKEGASLSAAEVGCQGEVGVACSMAAGAFASVMGGSTAQIENAAEIGMEHNLGLTCDPIAGLVQIPCIERNAMGAVKAVNAARLALQSDGKHVVSLDRVIAAMRKTGEDMLAQYKETSLGGLAVAVSVPEC